MTNLELVFGSGLPNSLDLVFGETSDGGGPISNVRVWDGSSWVTATLRVWDGSSWVLATSRVWDGSSWVT